MYCEKHTKMIRCNSIQQSECSSCGKRFITASAPPLDMLCAECSKKESRCAYCGEYEEGTDLYNREVVNLKLKIDKVNKEIVSRESDLDIYKDWLKKLTSDLHEACPHSVVSVEHIYDYDRNRYETTCIDCGKIVQRGSVFSFKTFHDKYSGKIVGDVPNISRI